MDVMEHLDNSSDRATQWSYDFPGPVEHFHTGTGAHSPAPVPVGDIDDKIDWEIGGQRGLVNNYMYSLGVTSSNTVENFELDGRQAIIRRMPEDSYGPVGTSDHNMLLSLAYAQQVNQFFPNEQSQYDLIKAV